MKGNQIIKNSNILHFSKEISRITSSPFVGYEKNGTKGLFISCPAARLQIRFHEMMRRIRGIYSSKYSYSFPSPNEDPNSMPLSSSGHLIISSFMFKKKKWGKHDQNIRLLKIHIYIYKAIKTVYLSTERKNSETSSL